MPRAKTRLLLVCLAFCLFFMPSCSEKPKNPVSEYGDALIGAYKSGQSAGEQADLDALKTAVRTYHAANEGYPKSLQDVGNMLSSRIDLTKYDYDPATGTVTLKPRQ